jgi:phenylpropionate dioxygenase-like ring-hydroxylating dioxygenase large terminal subunit
MADEFARREPPAGFPAFHDLPGGRYTEDRFFELERRHLWPRVWVMAGRAEDIPSPGDYFTFDDLGVPIIVLRGRDGVVRAYYNTCKHRGAPVVRETRGSARSLRCGYHGWTYDLDSGRLVSVPDERDFVGLCRDDRGLTPISCDVWENWIFVNQDPGAASLRDWFGVTLDQMEELSGSQLRALSLDSQTIACNWKVTAEAFLEVYHFRFIHTRGPAGGDTLLDSRGATMGLLPNGCSRMITPYSRSAAVANGMTDWSDWQHLVAPGFADIPAVNDMFRSTSSAFSFFPNLITPVGADGFPFLLFWPIDKRTTRLDWIFYAPKDWDGDDLPERWRNRIDAFNLIMEEDRRNMAPMQRSLDSPAFQGVPINYQERRIWHFHEQIDRTIGIERIPEELRVAQLLAPYVEGPMATSGVNR